MSGASISIKGHHELTLKSAILVYADKQKALATIHEVSGAYITPGRLLDPKTITHLLNQMVHTKAPTDLFPEHLLYANPMAEFFLWWVPEGQQTLWFASKDPFLNTLSGQSFAQPPLVFLWKHSQLYVYALQNNQRPVKDTQLFRAPYFNTTSGHVCLGSTAMPDVDINSLELVVSAFFSSGFTHGTNKIMTTFPGSYGEMWLANQKAFDTSLLIKENTILKDLL